MIATVDHQLHEIMILLNVDHRFHETILKTHEYLNYAGIDNNHALGPGI